MQDFNLCKAAAIGSHQTAGWLKTKLLKHRFAVRVMKLTAFLLLVCLLDVSAKAPAQEKITLKEKGASLINIFTQINKQTGYSFLFTNEDIKRAKPVDIDVKNAGLKDVLDILFKKQDLTYNISDKIITVQVKKNDLSPLKSGTSSVDDLNIHGKVVDENGKPVPGVTVTVKGTKKQTITDENGEFTIPGVETNAVLAFSTVNMQPFEIRIDGKTEILAKLKTKTSELDEVQIIAYGQTTKRFQTGNVSSIKAEDIQKQPVSNPLLALEGRVPGLFISQSTGFPGTGVQVLIQGQNSITMGNDPFYVVDGVPYSSQLLPSVTGILGRSSFNQPVMGNPLSFINPLDIESITVLKDADATAIYGSRASNGAILITTKKGKVGKTKFDLSVQNGWGKVVASKLKLLNTQQYLQMRHEAKVNDNAAITSSDYDINGLWDSTRYTDWQKELLGKTSSYNDAQASVSGGSENTQFLVGSGYHRETTVLPGNLFDEKGSFHFNINNTSINKKFRLQLSGSYLIDNNHLVNIDITNTAIQLAPDAPALYNADGTLNWMPNATGTSTWTNPLSYLYNKYTNKTNNLLSNLTLSYLILPNLEVKSSLGFNSLQSNEIQIYPLTAVNPSNRDFTPRSTVYGNNSIISTILEPQMVYKRSIAKGKLETLIGTSIQQNYSNGQQQLGLGYNSDLVLEDIKSAATVTVLSTVKSVYKYNGIFGRLNYNWFEKYILNLTARRDGSSRFGSEQQFHDFASVGAAWIFSNEKQIKARLPFLSYGKLKGSYGTTGNDQILDYQFLNLFTPLSVGQPYQGVPGIYPSGLTNPYLAWEETKKLQFGLDLGFLKDRIMVNANYFQNRSSNELLYYGLPIQTGFNVITKNLPATVQNSGLEMSLNTSNLLMKNFGWQSYINFTVFKNKLIAFPNLESSSYFGSLILGQPINLIKVYHFLGVDPTTGKYLFADSHGTPTSSPDDPNDKTVIINPMPSFYGGFENNFQYKGFSLEVLFQFVKQKGPNRYFGQWPGSKSINQPDYVLSRWEKPGDVTTIQKYNSNFKLLSLGNAARNSDAAYADASYIRLKNVSLSWMIPAFKTNKIHLQYCKIFAQGQNLLTITNYKGLDPETLSSTTLPPLRVVTLGIQIGL